MTVFMSALTLVQNSKQFYICSKKLMHLIQKMFIDVALLHINTVVVLIKHEELIYNSNRYEQYETMINILFS